MKNELRSVVAGLVASGLVATHGVDHGGVKAATVAERSVAIADAILAITEPTEEAEPAAAGAGAGLSLVPSPSQQAHDDSASD